MLKKMEGTSSTYKGISWDKNKKKWVASSTFNSKGINLGCFENEIDAGHTYDTFVLLHYGLNARTNGLVNYEDIKDIDINTLIKSRKERDLPMYIFKQDNSFQVHITFNGIKYRKTLPTLELAKEKLKEFQDIIDKIKKEEKEEHYKKEIIRNDDGDAIIPIKNKDDDIIDHIIVSDHRWHDCTQYNWSKCKNYFNGIIDGKAVKIHDYIIGLKNEDKDDNDLIDHIDHNPKNNKDDNLRLSNSVNNNHNRTKKLNTSSTFIGVSFNKSRNKFYASIKKDGVNYHIGSYIDELSAAKAYNFKAKELYGSFANLNLIDNEIITNENDNIVLNKLINNDTTKTKKPNCSSKYVGVCFHKRHNKFLASINVNGKLIHIGCYVSEEDAALAYNYKAFELFGEYANLNEL